MPTLLSPLTDAQRQLMPTAADTSSYNEHGYWISEVIIPDDVLDAAETGMRRFYAGDWDAAGTDNGEDGIVEVANRGTEWGSEIRKSDYASRVVRELADLIAYPMIGATAAVLSGADGIRLWHDQLLYKPTDQLGAGTKVGWHTDRQYWLSCSSAEMLTAWVGFHDVDPEGGSVGFFDRSHRWDVEGLDFFSQDLAGLEKSVAEQGFGIEQVPVTMRRGQVSFHHCRTVHGSGPNRRPEPRRSIAIHLQPLDNHFSGNLEKTGEVARHGNDQRVRKVDGVPDYADETVCPVLWQR